MNTLLNNYIPIHLNANILAPSIANSLTYK